MSKSEIIINFIDLVEALDGLGLKDIVIFPDEDVYQGIQGLLREGDGVDFDQPNRASIVFDNGFNAGDFDLVMYLGIKLYIGIPQ